MAMMISGKRKNCAIRREVGFFISVRSSAGAAATVVLFGSIYQNSEEYWIDLVKIKGYRNQRRLLSARNHARFRKLCDQSFFKSELHQDFSIVFSEARR